MPERIQLRRTKGWRMPEGAVYVGRPTMLGNPFRPVKSSCCPHWDVPCGTVTRALDQPCHADVLFEIANPTTTEES